MSVRLGLFVLFVAVVSSCMASTCLRTNADNMFVGNFTSSASKTLRTCQWYDSDSCCEPDATQYLKHEGLSYRTTWEGGDYSPACSEYYGLYRCRRCSPDYGSKYVYGENSYTTCQSFYEEFYKACRLDFYTKYTYVSEVGRRTTTFTGDVKNGVRLDTLISNAEEFYRDVLGREDSILWDKLQEDSNCWNAGNQVTPVVIFTVTLSAMLALALALLN